MALSIEEKEVFASILEAVKDGIREIREKVTELEARIKKLEVSRARGGANEDCLPPELSLESLGPISSP